MITAEQLRKIAKGKPNESNLNSMLVALDEYGERFELNKPHRLAHFLAQVMHESGGFRFDREIWGPTPAQKRYDVRTDLGNTPERDGDGKKNAGRGPIQLTGGDNIRAFENWCVREFGRSETPDFSGNPELINTDPWEGLSAVWYWTSRNLNRLADDNNIEMITRKVNGGLNGFDDRVDYYGRAALVLLGYGTGKAEIKRFQQDHPEAGVADGILGARTRMVMHKALQGANPFEERVPVPIPVDKPVVPEKVDKEVKKQTNFWTWLVGALSGVGTALSALAGAEWTTIIAVGGVGIVAVIVLLLMRNQLVAAIRGIREAVESEA